MNHLKCHECNKLAISSIDKNSPNEYNFISYVKERLGALLCISRNVRMAVTIFSNRSKMGN